VVTSREGLLQAGRAATRADRFCETRLCRGNPCGAAALRQPNHL